MSLFGNQIFGSGTKLCTWTAGGTKRQMVHLQKHKDKMQRWFLRLSNTPSILHSDLLSLTITNNGTCLGKQVQARLYHVQRRYVMSCHFRDGPAKSTLENWTLPIFFGLKEVQLRACMPSSAVPPRVLRGLTQILSLTFFPGYPISLSPARLTTARPPSLTHITRCQLVMVYVRASLLSLHWVSPSALSFLSLSLSFFWLWGVITDSSSSTSGDILVYISLFFRGLMVWKIYQRMDS